MFLLWKFPMLFNFLYSHTPNYLHQIILGKLNLGYFFFSWGCNFNFIYLLTYFKSHYHIDQSLGWNFVALYVPKDNILLFKLKFPFLWVHKNTLSRAKWILCNSVLSVVCLTQLHKKNMPLLSTSIITFS